LWGGSGGGEVSYRPVVRDQEFLLPPRMTDWLADDHLVWFVLDVVAGLGHRAVA
jgi:hypothetical protein